MLVPLRSYECRLLGGDLKAARTVTFDCQTVDDAIEKAVEILRVWKDGMPLVGFELLEGNMRIFYRLASSKIALGLSLSENATRAPEKE